jgi:hypothetical protein
MKYLKLFEIYHETTTPKVGDYVMVKEMTLACKWLENEIGYIIDDKRDSVCERDYFTSPYRYIVAFDIVMHDPRESFLSSIPEGFRKETNLDDKYQWYRPYDTKEIKEFSSNIDDLEFIVSTNKYNL